MKFNDPIFRYLVGLFLSFCIPYGGNTYPGDIRVISGLIIRKILRVEYFLSILQRTQYCIYRK